MHTSNLLVNKLIDIISGQGFIVKLRISKQLLAGVKNTCNSTLLLSKNTLDQQLMYNNVNTNKVQRFHTQILTSYQFTQKDSKSIDRNNSSMVNKI